VYLYSAYFVVPHTQVTHAWITQFYLQLHQCLHLPCNRSPDGASSDWGCGHLIATYYSFSNQKGWKVVGCGIYTSTKYSHWISCVNKIYASLCVRENMIHLKTKTRWDIDEEMQHSTPWDLVSKIFSTSCKFSTDYTVTLSTDATSVTLCTISNYPITEHPISCTGCSSNLSCPKKVISIFHLPS